MSRYEEISKAVLHSAIDNHQLAEWYECLSNEQKAQVIAGLDKRIGALIDEHYKELDRFVVKSIILGGTENPSKPKSKIDNIRTIFAKGPEESGLNFKIMNYSNLSDEEVQEMAEELYRRMSDVLGF